MRISSIRSRVRRKKSNQMESVMHPMSGPPSTNCQCTGISLANPQDAYILAQPISSCDTCLLLAGTNKPLKFARKQSSWYECNRQEPDVSTLIEPLHFCDPSIDDDVPESSEEERTTSFAAPVSHREQSIPRLRLNSSAVTLSPPLVFLSSPIVKLAYYTLSSIGAPLSAILSMVFWIKRQWLAQLARRWWLQSWGALLLV
jgi:hypothetical protein